MLRLSLAVFVLAVSSACWSQPPAKTREQKVRADRRKVESENFWIYNDLHRGFELAKRQGKPLLVVLRCIPCEECVKLDDALIDQDPRLRALLSQFVCVRQVSTNGLDLALFQFDTDQSFAVFLLNADGTIYGRFGTRSHRTEWLGDVSPEGLAKAMEGALALHLDYPKNREALAGKRGPKPVFARPEDQPPHRGKYSSSLDFAGDVVKKCIHCHQIGDALRQDYRSRSEPIPEEVLFPYPHPKVVGLTLDPREKASVLQVEPKSAAEAAGIVRGDEIVTLAGQPLLSIADFQWILHNAPAAGAELPCELRRAGQMAKVQIRLKDGWRRAGDLSWRSSTWGLRRMAAGGLVLEPVHRADRLRAGLTERGMALRVKHVGQYGPHAAAKQAGFRVGDVLVEVDGQDDMARECDFLAYGVTKKKVGEQITVGVLRDGKRIGLSLPMQE
jgi:serine protease Do